MKHINTILLLLVLNSPLLVAQTTVSINFSPTRNAKIQLTHLNTPDLKGSQLYTSETNGSIFSINVISSIGNKIGLKIGLGSGTLRQKIRLYASPVFVNYEELDSYNYILRNPNFIESSIGINFPIQLNPKNRLHLSIGTYASYVKGINRTIDLTSSYSAGNNPNGYLTYLKGEVNIYNKNEFQIGLSAEIMYEYRLKDMPIGFQFGITGSHTPKPFLSGWIHLIGDQETLKTTISQNISYVGLKLGISYTFDQTKY